MKKQVALLMIFKNNKLLLFKRNESDKTNPGKWALLGGGIEPGESPSQALTREIKEEGGFLIDNFTFLKKYGYGDVIIHVFYTDNIDENLIKLNNEHSDFKYFTEEELKNEQNTIKTNIQFWNDYNAVTKNNINESITQLNEFGDKPLPWSQNIGSPDEISYKFNTPQNEYVAAFNDINEDGNFDFSFYPVNGDTNQTNENVSLSVLATAVDILRDFLTNHTFNSIIILPISDNQIDNKRYRIFQHLIKQSFPEYNLISTGAALRISKNTKLSENLNKMKQLMVYLN